MPTPSGEPVDKHFLQAVAALAAPAAGRRADPAVAQ
jgi:hypothetical protein